MTQKRVQRPTILKGNKKIPAHPVKLKKTHGEKIIMVPVFLKKS